MLSLPFRPHAETAWCLRFNAACEPKRNAQNQSTGAFHISGLANPDNLAVQKQRQSEVLNKAALLRQCQAGSSGKGNG
jgi:hypothetical protein